MILNKLISISYSAVFIIISLLTPAIAQDSHEVSYATLPGSKLWFDGTSNIDKFICTSHQVNGYAEIINDSKMKSNSLEKDKVVVTIQVHSLDCGKELMNEDMYNAMKADKFPDLKYELLEAKTLNKTDSTNWYSLQTRGILFIAGEKNIVDIDLKVENLRNGYFRLTGSLPISMLDYAIVPPTHFFGLIKAHENLIVHFDILAHEENKFTKSAQHGISKGKVK